MKIDLGRLVVELQKINPYAPKAAIARMLGRSRQRLHQVETEQDGVAIVTPEQLKQVEKVFFKGNAPAFKSLIARLKL